VRIYFSAAISAGRSYAPVYKKIVEVLNEKGFSVLTEFVADSEVLTMDKHVSPAQVYERDVRLVHEADAILAEISHPSTGVGYEIAYALHHNKPVIAVYLSGLNVTKMISGNNHPNLSIYSYESVNELLDRLPDWIHEKQRKSA
jgi:hypothetical protein